MKNVFLFLISLGSIGLMFFLLYRAIKKVENLAEKMADIILSIIIATLLTVYYLDRYNIPTTLNLTMNINSQNWLALIGNYFTGIVSSIIGAFVAVYTTIYQIKKNNEENKVRDSESNRISNMPIIKYEIGTRIEGDINIGEIILGCNNIQDSRLYDLDILIKNVGRNTIKNIIVDFNSEIINKSTYRLSGKNRVNVLEKNDVMEIRRVIRLNPSKNKYVMSLIIYYQDILGNWYRQQVSMNYFPTDKFDRGRYIGNVCFETNKEEIIAENNIENNAI